MGKTSILLVDDHIVVREGLRALLAIEADLEVVAEAGNGQEAIALAKKHRPDIVVMDIALPIMNGLSATKQILRAVPTTRVLVLSSYSNDDCVKEMLTAGASGFLMKQTASTELVQAVRLVRRGNEYLSAPIAQRMRNQRNAALISGNGHAPRPLTARELEVLKLIADGLSNKEISAALDISIKTVEKHRQQVMNKVNIHEVAGLTRYALEKGIVAAKVPVAA